MYLGTKFKIVVDVASKLVVPKFSRYVTLWESNTAVPKFTNRVPLGTGSAAERASFNKIAVIYFEDPTVATTSSRVSQTSSWVRFTIRY